MIKIMNTMKNILFTLACILGMSTVGQSQTMKAFIASAENAFLTKDYYSALVYYSDALEFDSDRIDLRYQSAEAARLFNAYVLAEESYTQVVESEINGEYPLATFWLADMKQKLGKYEESKFLFDRYVSENGDDNEYFQQKALKEIKACEWALELIQYPDESTMLHRLGEEVNTAYSEFAGLKKEDTLYYSSLRFKQTKSDYIPERVVSKVLKSVDGGIGEELENGLNDPAMHTAHSTFNTTEDKMYYTICNYVNNEDIRCDLYVRTVSPSGVLGPEEKLPEFINSDAFTTTQPNIGFDVSSEREILYFVSDRPGGEGKLDIWYSLIDEELGYTEPLNVSAINTIENDITPFYHLKSNKLFFSSEGYQSLGGYDIYKADKVDNGFYGKPEHLTYPTNSSFHDIYYTENEKSSEAYFSSNREGALYLDEGKEACCFDIYEIKMEEVLINLNALTFDARTSTELTGATVRLIDATTGVEVEYVENQEGNEHLFALAKDRNYIVVADRAGFDSDTIQFTTKKIFKSEDFTKKLFLNSDLVSLEVLTFNKMTSAALAGTTVKLVDISNGESERDVKVNPLTNQFDFEIERGKRYRIVASKASYSDVSISFEIPVDIAETKITKKLYLGNLEVFLPVKLYFDNDRPDRNTLKTNTKKSYTDTYYPYIAKKQQYMKGFARPFKGEEKNIASAKVERFFENDIKQGFNKMNAFIEELSKALESGAKIELTVGGFASPRWKSDYNLALAQRRIATVHNELFRYGSGEFIPYLQSGTLVVNDISYGERLSPIDISDNLKDRPKSVYSVEASKERRVEIISIKYLN